jgi:uncharacterized protein (TIGR02646 family)
MIPVRLEPEPADFDRKVRQPGHCWLRNHQIALNGPPPKATDLPPKWRKSLKQLWAAYSGICAYLSIYLAWDENKSSVDHFTPKSKHAGKAYEWGNYRLSEREINSRKADAEDLCDPVDLKPDTFFLSLDTGKIFPNQALSEDDQAVALRTIKLLGLDRPENNRMRHERFFSYIKKEVDAEHLKRESPFVWHEAQRQGLL